MKIILRVLVIAACLVATTAQAQWTTYRPEKSLMLLGWGLAQPIGNLGDFQSGTSISGFSMEFRSMVKPRLSTGLAFDYNRFTRTNSLETISRPDGATLSAPTFRYSDMFSIKATAHYYLADGALRPYLGAGLGGNWSYAYLQTADLASTDHGFTIIVTPEAGVLVELARGGTNVALNASIRYNFTSSYFFNVARAQWFSEVVGISVSY
jgi:outer membrane protein W